MYVEGDVEWGGSRRRGVASACTSCIKRQFFSTSSLKESVYGTIKFFVDASQ
jgi:hypothetical protein